MHGEIHQLFVADQADRNAEPPRDIHQRDRARRRRLEQLIAQGALQTHEDYLHAAFIFQHGDQPS